MRTSEKPKARINDPEKGWGQCDETGNQWKDWIDFVSLVRGVGKLESAKFIADTLGIVVAEHGQSSGKATSTTIPNGLELLPWNSTFVGLYLKLIGLEPSGESKLKDAGQKFGKYHCNNEQGKRASFNVLAVPVWGTQGSAVQPANWIVIRTDGGKLPTKDGPTSKKTIGGGNRGIIGDIRQIDQLIAGNLPDGIAVKVEGITDWLAAYLRDDWPDGTMIWTNPFGCRDGKSTAQKASWSISAFAGREVWIIHDADKPGQRGAADWCKQFVPVGATAKNVTLPFVVEREKGPDLRDYFNGGGTVENLMERAESAGPTESTPHAFDSADESSLTDLSNATRFIDQFGDQLLFIPEWRKWLRWDGTRWRDDSGVGARQRAHQYAKSLWQDLAKAGPVVEESRLSKICTFVRATNQSTKIDAFTKLAQVDERVVCPVTKLNRSKHLLNVLNGTIDLRTGELRPHDPEDRITQIAGAAYDPDAECPRWLDTLNLIFDDNAELIRFVQQLLGYAVSGDTGEHILPIGWGDGRNGKSTIWSVVVEVLGDYAGLANESLLMGDTRNHPTEIAQLYQKRFIAISEPEKGAKLRESRVKELTGDRQITARRMHEDFWTFERTHTFWLSTNHKPRISGTDQGIWRRIKLIPFNVDIRQKVGKPIPDFDRWLVDNEGPGILAWLVRGHVDYRQNGFMEATAVTQATKLYRDDSDLIGQFIGEYCIVEKKEIVPASELFGCFRDDFGGKWTQTSFGKSMKARGFDKKRLTEGGKKLTCYIGLGLKEETVSSHAVANETKSPENTASNAQDTHGHSYFGSFHASIENLEPTNQLCPTTSEGKTCPKCSDAMFISELTHDGYENWECKGCGHVVPVKVQVDGRK